MGFIHCFLFLLNYSDNIYILIYNLIYFKINSTGQWSDPNISLCIIISSLAEVYTSYLIKPIVDDYITPLIGQENPDFSNLISMALFYLLIVVIGGITAYIYNIIMVRISTRTLLDLRNELFEKLEKLPIKFHDQNTHGEIMSRFTNDIDAIRQMISMSLPQMVTSLVMMIYLLIFMFKTNALLALIVIATVFIMLVITRF